MHQHATHHLCTEQHGHQHQWTVRGFPALSQQRVDRDPQGQQHRHQQRPARSIHIGAEQRTRERCEGAIHPTCIAAVIERTPFGKALSIQHRKQHGSSPEHEPLHDKDGAAYTALLNDERQHQCEHHQAEQGAVERAPGTQHNGQQQGPQPLHARCGHEGQQVMDRHCKEGERRPIATEQGEEVEQERSADPCRAEGPSDRSVTHPRTEPPTVPRVDDEGEHREEPQHDGRFTEELLDAPGHCGHQYMVARIPLRMEGQEVAAEHVHQPGAGLIVHQGQVPRAPQHQQAHQRRQCRVQRSGAAQDDHLSACAPCAARCASRSSRLGRCAARRCPVCGSHPDRARRAPPGAPLRPR